MAEWGRPRRPVDENGEDEEDEDEDFYQDDPPLLQRGRGARAAGSAAPPAAFRSEPRSPSHGAIVTEPGTELDLHGGAAERMRSQNGTTKFDLLFNITPRGDTLAGFLEYDAELFLPETARQLTRSLCVLLAAITRNPEQRVGDFDLLEESDRTRLAHWNDTRSNYPRASRLHELFEGQVQRAPDAIALIHGDQRINYGDLDRRSNGLLSRLFDAGVGPGDRVGLLLSRSVELVVATLAVLKAGAAYVPLDPDDPPQRIAGLRTAVSDWMKGNRFPDLKGPLAVLEKSIAP
jgi:non-ribosomal peptide synthetase component F